MGVKVNVTGTPGRVNSTDLARFIVLENQRNTVGLDDSQRDEYKCLGQKISEIKHGASAANA